MKIYSHDKQMLHHPRSYFSRGKMREPQEIPERLTELLKAPKALGLTVMTAKDLGIDPILAVHDFDYIDFLKHGYEEWISVSEELGTEVQTTIYAPNNNAAIGILAKAAKYQADGSAPIGKHSWESIYWSAQTALNAAEDLLVDKATSSDTFEQNNVQICMTRPAGHHARRSAAGGFCYLNNAAIIAEHLRQKFKKIAIIDTDMHHGQGIQEIFYDRKDVLYTSVHGSPINFYPVVAGHEHERGQGKGYGYNVNFPMPHGTDEAGFFHYVDKAIGTLMLFNPDVVVHVLGFDVYTEDPQAKCSVSTAGFKTLAQRLKVIDKPLIVLVEGGYCIEKLNENMQSFLSGFVLQKE